MEEDIQKKFNNLMAKEVSIATDKGFVRGVKWIGDFIILEMEYQNLHEMAQKLKIFINNKEQEILKTLDKK